MDLTLSKREKTLLLRIARETIESACLNRSANYDFLTPGGGENSLEGEASVSGPPSVFYRYCGAFVSLHKQGKLRGCIGNMVGERTLLETVKKMARSAAFEDPRFPSLTADELHLVDIEISVLSPLTGVTRLTDIQVGTHGIYLRRRGASGVLLPQVAVEQGWDRLTFLRQTCRKAGLVESCYADPETEIQIFSAIIFGEKG